jgi:hypothetical protein
MIIDFRKTKTEIPELQVEQSPISRVSSYKLLGVWIDNNLKWETNTWAVIKKGRKRLYFLKILKNYGALTKDLLAFYNSIIRPVLEYGDVLSMQYRKDSKTSISYNISRTRLRTGIESKQVDNIGTTKKRPLFQVNIRYD